MAYMGYCIGDANWYQQEQEDHQTLWIIWMLTAISLLLTGMPQRKNGQKWLRKSSERSIFLEKVNIPGFASSSRMYSINKFKRIHTQDAVKIHARE